MHTHTHTHTHTHSGCLRRDKTMSERWQKKSRGGWESCQQFLIPTSTFLLAGATWLRPLPHSAEGLAGAHPVGMCVTDTHFTPVSLGGWETSLCDWHVSGWSTSNHNMIDDTWLIGSRLTDTRFVGMARPAHLSLSEEHQCDWRRLSPAVELATCLQSCPWASGKGLFSPLSLKQRMHLQLGHSSSAPDLAVLPGWASGSVRAQYEPCSSLYTDQPGPSGVHSRLLKWLFKAPYATFRVLNLLSRGCRHSEPLGKGPARELQVTWRHEDKMTEAKYQGKQRYLYRTSSFSCLWMILTWLINLFKGTKSFHILYIIFSL